MRPRTEKRIETMAFLKSVKGKAPFFLICGCNVLEDLESTLRLAKTIQDISSKVGIGVIFKGSFDKANRTSAGAFRGPGLNDGIAILREVRERIQIPVITDVHEPWQTDVVGKHVDMLQIPAFLCRQTDLLEAAARVGKPVLIKKGQFASPQVAIEAARKVVHFGNDQVILCERGFAFGYHDLVLDVRSLVWMRRAGFPVVMDVSHAAQLPSAVVDPCSQQRISGGDRSLVPTLARAAVAVGIDGLFIECHETPDQAPVDSATQWPVDKLQRLLLELRAIAEAAGHS